jgi:hypothetical protein
MLVRLNQHKMQREIVALQDKFAVGPVTLVQLVGLASSPRIPSVHTDGAVRAADPALAATAGLGGRPQEPVSDVVSSYFALKAAAPLGLSADPLRAHSAFDAGVDRPDPNDAPAPKFDTSTLHHVSTDSGIMGATTDDGRVTIPAVADSPGTAPGATSDGSLAPRAVFDGSVEFGDDQILNFSEAAQESSVATPASIATGSDADVALVVAFSAEGHDSFDTVDLSGEYSGPPSVSDVDHIIDPAHLISGSDAVPLF